MTPRSFETVYTWLKRKETDQSWETLCNRWTTTWNEQCMRVSELFENIELYSLMTETEGLCDVTSGLKACHRKVLLGGRVCVYTVLQKKVHPFAFRNN